MNAAPSPELQAARYRGKRDTFLGLWLELGVYARQRTSTKQVHRALTRFLRSRALLVALETEGIDAVERELRDAARQLVAITMDDPGFATSHMGLVRRTPRQVRRALAQDAVHIAALVDRLPPLPLDAMVLIRAMLSGCRDALGPDGIEELRDATADEPGLRAVIDTFE